jgi:SAM-dependent methyltransferase
VTVPARVTPEFRRERRSQRLASVITSEIILDELDAFLHEHYGGSPGSMVLDLGAGTKPYAPIYESYFADCTSVDVAWSPHDIRGVAVITSADSLPFEDGSFDCVICTEVLEHCSDPAAVFSEIHRTLKPGGRVFLTTPFIAPLHEMPNDFYRYTPSALRFLAESQGLTVTSLRPRGEYVAVAMRLLQMPLTKVWQRLSRLVGRDLYSARNPLVYLSLVLPQQLYVIAWRLTGIRRGPLARLFHDKLSYYTLGYITTLRRDS